jgi:Glyoxalase superfamily protein
MEIKFVARMLRIFDIAKADEFYQGFLGFSVD